MVQCSLTWWFVAKDLCWHPVNVSNNLCLIATKSNYIDGLAASWAKTALELPWCRHLRFVFINFSTLNCELVWPNMAAAPGQPREIITQTPNNSSKLSNTIKTFPTTKIKLWKRRSRGNWKYKILKSSSFILDTDLYCIGVSAHSSTTLCCLLWVSLCEYWGWMDGRT